MDSAPVLLPDHVYRGDCLAHLPRLPSGSVDLAFADPPFNIGYDYDVYQDRHDAEHYLAWSRRWGAEVVRALKPDGAFWLAIGDEYAAELKLIFQKDLGTGTVNEAKAITNFDPDESWSVAE